MDARIFECSQSRRDVPAPYARPEAALDRSMSTELRRLPTVAGNLADLLRTIGASETPQTPPDLHKPPELSSTRGTAAPSGAVVGR